MMSSDSLKQFLKEYPDGISCVIFQQLSKLEAWGRSDKQDETEFTALDVRNLPKSSDYRELVQHFSRIPLIIDGEKFTLNTYK